MRNMELELERIKMHIKSSTPENMCMYIQSHISWLQSLHDRISSLRLSATRLERIARRPTNIPNTVGSQKPISSSLESTHTHGLQEDVVQEPYIIAIDLEPSDDDMGEPALWQGRTIQHRLGQTPVQKSTRLIRTGRIRLATVGAKRRIRFTTVGARSGRAGNGRAAKRVGADTKGVGCCFGLL